MSDVEVAWVAGIIEGEGCFSFKSNNQAAVIVCMVDKDVIDQLAAWTGVGVVVPKRARRSQYQDQWRWTVTAQNDFLALAEKIRPWMKARRGARLDEVCAALLAHRERVDTWGQRAFVPGVGICRNGHDKGVVGVRPDGECITCSRATKTRYNRKARGDKS
jgi:hypothetical protein